MKKRSEAVRAGVVRALIFGVAALSCLAPPRIAAAAAAGDPSIAPRTGPGGRKFRIGYCETKTFVNFASHVNTLIRGIQAIGWIKGVDDMPYVKGQIDTTEMWKYVSSRDLGPYLEFVPDAYYTFEGIKGDDAKKLADAIFDRLNNKKDIDLMIVEGTDAAKYLVNDKHKTPMLVFTTADIVKSGVMKSNEDSGRDHIWGHVDPLRYPRQVQIFHDIFKFKRLGVPYEDSTFGRSGSAIEAVEAVAKERGFEVVRALVKQPDLKDMEGFYAQLLAAHKELAKKVDALYFGLFIGLEVERLAEMLAPFTERNIPVFAQQGSEYVKYGALISVGRADFKGIGLFGASTIARVLNGATPRKLPQTYENSPNIALNLEVARKIGYKPTFDIFLVCDDVFQKVEEKPTAATAPPPAPTTAATKPAAKPAAARAK